MTARWVVVAAPAAIGLGLLAARVTPAPFPHPVELRWEQHALGDMGGLLLGMRRLAADVAWIQLLQYYGSPETHGEDNPSAAGVTHGHAHAEFGGGRYPEFLARARRVVEIDPTFHYAYLYAASSLAWNLDRPNEALWLLADGVSRSPTYWRFRMYAAAILYRERGRFDDMLTLLENAADYPDCPNMVRVLLARVYESRRLWGRAETLWEQIRLSGDPDYLHMARQKLTALHGRR